VDNILFSLLTSIILLIKHVDKKNKKENKMNEQLANKIRSRLSGGESYDHMSPSIIKYSNPKIYHQLCLQYAGNA
jgi:hypothetical protein